MQLDKDKGKDECKEQEQAQEPQMELDLVLIRHGHTQWNKERRYLGSTDLPLLAEARQQLSALSDQPALGGEFRRVYCSDLLRCRETLAAVAPQLERQAIYDSRLRELDFGAWEGRTYEQLKDNGHYRSWIDHPELVTPPEGESWGQFEARVDSFWAQLEQEVAEAEAEAEAGESVPAGTDSAGPGETIAKTAALESASSLGPAVLRVLLVTHGGVIRQLLARFTEGTTFYTAAAPAPGEVTVMNLRRYEGTWRRIAREA